MTSKLSDDASTVQAEAAQKTKLYELELRKRTSAHPDSFTEGDIDTLAAELLKQKSRELGGTVRAGSLHPSQTHSHDAEDGTGDEHEQPVSEFIADEISGLDDFIDDTRQKYQKADPAKDLTPDEKLEYQVIMRARESLLKRDASHQDIYLSAFIGTPRIDRVMLGRLKAQNGLDATEGSLRSSST